MTLQDFDDKLKAACPGLVHELAAPKGAVRFAVWHQYGCGSTYGDDCNQIDAPKVQIDIHTQHSDDMLADEVCAALWEMGLPYSIQSVGYDDDYADIRTILQLVVI